MLFVEWNTTYYVRRGEDPSAVVGAALDGLEYVTARRDGQRWDLATRFYSPKPLDHLVMIPAERVLTALAALPAPRHGRVRRTRGRPAR